MGKNSHNVLHVCGKDLKDLQENKKFTHVSFIEISFPQNSRYIHKVQDLKKPFNTTKNSCSISKSLVMNRLFFISLFFQSSCVIDQKKNCYNFIEFITRFLLLCLLLVCGFSRSIWSQLFYLNFIEKFNTTSTWKFNLLNIV